MLIVSSKQFRDCMVCRAVMGKRTAAIILAGFCYAMLALRVFQNFLVILPSMTSHGFGLLIHFKAKIHIN